VGHSLQNLPTDDEACVLHAMFPVKFTNLHKSSSAPAPARAIAPAVPPPPTASVPSASTVVAHRYDLTSNGRRIEVSVVEVN
jgi:oxaloacetate decarboxylase alpha subunit/pyruvate carboxylase subunit B